MGKQGQPDDFVKMERGDFFKAVLTSLFGFVAGMFEDGRL